MTVARQEDILEYPEQGQKLIINSSEPGNESLINISESVNISESGDEPRINNSESADELLISNPEPVNDFAILLHILGYNAVNFFIYAGLAVNAYMSFASQKVQDTYVCENAGENASGFERTFFDLGIFSFITFGTIFGVLIPAGIFTTDQLMQAIKDKKISKETIDWIKYVDYHLKRGLSFMSFMKTAIDKAIELRQDSTESCTNVTSTNHSRRMNSYNLSEISDLDKLRYSLYSTLALPLIVEGLEIFMKDKNIAKRILKTLLEACSDASAFGMASWAMVDLFYDGTHDKDLCSKTTNEIFLGVAGSAFFLSILSSIVGGRVKEVSKHISLGLNIFFLSVMTSLSVVICNAQNMFENVDNYNKRGIYAVIGTVIGGLIVSLAIAKYFLANEYDYDLDETSEINNEILSIEQPSIQYGSLVNENLNIVNNENDDIDAKSNIKVIISDSKNCKFSSEDSSFLQTNDYSKHSSYSSFDIDSSSSTEEQSHYENKTIEQKSSEEILSIEDQPLVESLPVTSTKEVILSSSPVKLSSSPVKIGIFANSLDAVNSEKEIIENTKTSSQGNFPK